MKNKPLFTVIIVLAAGMFFLQKYSMKKALHEAEQKWETRLNAQLAALRNTDSLPGNEKLEDAVKQQVEQAMANNEALRLAQEKQQKETFAALRIDELGRRLMVEKSPIFGASFQSRIDSVHFNPKTRALTCLFTVSWTTKTKVLGSIVNNSSLTLKNPDYKGKYILDSNWQEQIFTLEKNEDLMEIESSGFRLDNIIELLYKADDILSRFQSR